MRSDERELFAALLRAAYTESETDSRLAHAVVQDMSDGGMGSIRFANSASRKRRLGQVAAVAEYVDEDGIPVSIALNLDDKGNLFEVDFWKGDFSRLLRYPKPEDLRIRETSGIHEKSSEAAVASRP